MKANMAGIFTAIMSCAMLCACGNTSKTAESPIVKDPEIVLGAFSPDSAYRYVAEQVAFGPRVPGTKQHDNCGAYLVDRLKEFGADTVITQNAEVTAFNGDVLPITNIFAQFNTKASNRILLVAHWDTRPWANMEANEEDRVKPVLGANDGGSGVGVILEIARNLGIKAPECGVDILFADAEDYGSSKGFTNSDESWCLGSQYWVKNMPYNTVNRPAYGILLDMVGGRGAKFHREHFSHTNAKTPTIKIWSEAKNLGLDEFFINDVGGAVVDDHTFITEAGIPTTDVIEHLSDVTGNFPATWHTLDDTMRHISRRTLGAVGKTVLNVIYKESAK